MVDEELRPLPPGAVGEIRLRHRHVMTGYLKNPEATAATLVDGWIRSGDLGFLDEAGALHFAGRLKNVIKRSGENISAEEVEAALEAHPDVAEALVVGVPDRLRTEEVGAVVVARAGAALDPRCPGQRARRAAGPLEAAPLRRRDRRAAAAPRQRQDRPRRRPAPGRARPGVGPRGRRRAAVTAPDALTPDGLTPLLREHLGPEARCRSVVRGPLGNGQETWFVEVEGAGPPGGLVLRRSAEGGTLPWTDRAAEFAVLRAVGPHGLPVPAALWLEDEPSSLGRPYFVMERARGEPLGRADAAARAAVATQLGQALARLHRLPQEGLAPAAARPADGPAGAREELARWGERYEAVRPPGVPMLGALLAWLEGSAPREPAPAVLLWGDPGPHNVLVRGRARLGAARLGALARRPPARRPRRRGLGLRRRARPRAGRPGLRGGRRRAG